MHLFKMFNRAVAIHLRNSCDLLIQVRLIDAGFLWTEPHSKRIKLKVTIQKEVRGEIRGVRV